MFDPTDLDAQMEYDLLRKFAGDLKFHAQVHRDFDPMTQAPGREKAFWYLQPNKSWRKESNESILRYATADEVYAWLIEYRRQQSAA